MTAFNVSFVARAMGPFALGVINSITICTKTSLNLLISLFEVKQMLEKTQAFEEINLWEWKDCCNVHDEI